ncbi:MAG: glycerol-3-phosphate acyltransferase [Bacteroidota bacterium]
MQNISSLLIGYLFGSLPTAFLVMKYLYKLDIRKVGSGNVGGRNSYEVSGKLSVGIFVGIVDSLKGVAAILFIQNYFNDVNAIGFAFVGAVAGHCYSIWIGFKGGRGLGTAAGGLLILMWPLIIFWLVGYALVGKFTKSVHISIVGAVLLSILFVIIFNNYNLLEKNSYLISSSLIEMQNYFLGVALVIIATCIKPIKEFLEGKSEE